MHIRIEQNRGNVGGKDLHVCEWETTGFWYNASKIPPCFSPIQRWRGWLLWLEIPSIAMNRSMHGTQIERGKVCYNAACLDFL